ncbi:MAG: SpoIIE family protein phosphatase [Spirochaetaceae bacterium]|nr:SpoIIE family protein phosphatase [Spirochaetaceae bacterium]
MWQEYIENDERGGLLSLYSSVSTDGLNWSDKVNVTGTLPFSWDQKVSLFSMVVNSQGEIIVAFADSEQSISFYRSTDKGVTYVKTSVITSDNTLVAPRLFLKENDGVILFVTQKADLFIEGIPGTLSIYYAESNDNNDWSQLNRFVENDNLLQSFLPYYTHWNGDEYVVFQAIISSVNFQLFFKKRDRDTGEWTEAVLLSDFTDPANPDIDYSDFSNQRPFLIGIDDHLSLVWERNEFGLNSRVYYVQLDEEGNFISDVDIVTDDFRISAFPSIINYKGEEILLWFDNRDGYRIIMAQKRGLFWDDGIVSTINGDSTYGSFVPFTSETGEEELLIAWENISGTNNRSVILSPDQTVNTPRVSAVNFLKGRRSSQEFPVFSWTEPVDSSFIRGFSYIWTQDPLEEPPRKLDLRGDPLRRRTSFQATDEGLWYFKVIAEDYALNWSDSASISFFYDRTPPEEVVFKEIPTDPMGYALSNTFDLQWEDPPEEQINRYYYNISFLGREILDSSYGRMTYSTPTTEAKLDNKVSINNFDNGYWGITVIAEDSAGNKSKPSIQVFRLNKYIPVTYITNITSVTDDLLRVKLTIRGRGFASQGKIRSVIIDKDGKLPWDLQYNLAENAYSVTDDRTISGPLIDDIEGGVYRIAVEHPERGIVFARNQLKFEPTGVVKFGDFSTDYESIWDVIPYRVTTVPGNFILALSVLFLLGLLITISSFKLFQFSKEFREFTYNSKALFDGTLLTEELKKEKLKTMKRKGVGLRIKFLMALLSLVISVILMIAISLGLYMINLQKENLGDSMRQRAELLLETLVSGAENSLQLSALDRSLGLNVIPKQISAMDEALYTTITGLGLDDPGVYNYIWAHNDPDINSKFILPETLSGQELEKLLTDSSEDEQLEIYSVYKEEEGVYKKADDTELSSRLKVSSLLYKAGLVEEYTIGGEKQIFDEISPSLIEVADTINQQGKEIVGDIPAQIAELNRKGVQLAVSGASAEEINLINDDIRELSEQLDERLTNIADKTFVYPEYIPEELNRNQMEYIFYRPIVYEDSTSDTFYRGTVRLRVSVELILDKIDQIIINLIRITVLISLAALALGVVGALILASTMINPIKKLVEGVERIRDTEDKTKLKGQDIQVKSKDELADLAGTINDMAAGLVKAAVASQQVTLGKEVQKKFIPLEPVPSGDDRKLSTGSEYNDLAEFYGYYEGAKGVSGDYFSYRKIDANHYACIKCDISGKDIPASLIMVEVATIFNSYCKNLNLKKDGIHLDQMVANVNDLIEELNFIGRFAAFTIVLINTKTGKTWMSNAGDNVVHYFDAQKREMDKIELFKAPAAGPFPSSMVNFKQEIHNFRSGDILFLFTDGVEESQSYFRNSALEIIKCEGCDFSGVEGSTENRDTDTHLISSDNEEMGLKRIDEICNALVNGTTYELIKHHNPFSDQKLTFDFTGCDDSIEDGVLGLLSVEKIFRLFPDPNAGVNDRIMVDRKIDNFLKKHFDQYNEYFRYPIDHPEFPEYIYYTHLKETAQYDDLTVLAIRLK